MPAGAVSPRVAPCAQEEVCGLIPDAARRSVTRRFTRRRGRLDPCLCELPGSAPDRRSVRPTLPVRCTSRLLSESLPAVLRLHSPDPFALRHPSFRDRPGSSGSWSLAVRDGFVGLLETVPRRFRCWSEPLALSRSLSARALPPSLLFPGGGTVPSVSELGARLSLLVVWCCRCGVLRGRCSVLR